MSYSYTASGQIATVTDQHGTSRYSYNGDGRLLSSIDPNGATVSYSYDALGRKTSVTVPSGTTEYDYDDFGRLVSVTDPDGNETRYTYDEHGNKASMISPNGTITEYDYDNLNRLIAVETRNITGTLLASYSYTLNTKGQRTHVEEQPTGRLIDYAYDTADRLVEERITDPVLGNRTISYSYDPVGNRLTKDDNGVVTEYSYDANDRLLTETGYSYIYDHNGNMLTKSGNGETWQLDYNALNQLIHAEMTSSQGTTTIDYVYDHDGIRVGKTINGTDEVTYLVDANRPYAQVIEEAWTRGGLSATTNYVYGHGLVSQIIDGVNRFYHYDGFHNTRALSDMSGAVTDTYHYDAYGTLLNQTGTTSNPYLYRGEQYDAETNSYYLRARNYQPEIGRFLSTDPLEGDTSDPMTLHRYMYGNNDPVNHIDPLGQFSIQDATQAVGIIGVLSGISAGTWFAGDHIPGLDNVYNWIAEYLAPDAGILGLNLLAKFRGQKPPKPFSGVPDLLLPDILWPNSKNLWWKERINAGIIAGTEVMWNFGSAQRGYFMYWGFQAETGYTNEPNRSRVDFEANLYTGYVFNLWNCDDYLGDFMGLNFPSGSFFFDPARIVDNWGPWGLAWTIGGIATRANSSQSKMFGFNQTIFARVQAFPPTNVSYGKLAIEWTLLQASLTAYFAFSSQNTAAVATGFGTAFTGLIAKSKQIYNKKHKFDLTERRQGDRPPLWKNGPPNPLSKLLGLFL